MNKSLQIDEKKVIAELEHLFALDCPEPQPRRKRHFPSWAAVLLGLGAGLLLANSVSLFANHESQSSSSTTTVTTVGAEVPQGRLPINPALSAHKSLISGIVDADSMSAAYYYALYFKNTSTTGQEAEMRIRIPKGAAVTRATLWINGVAQEAAFADTSTVTQAYNWIVRNHRDPLLVTQVDEETISIKASPVMPGGQGMKLRIGITAPLHRDPHGNIVGELPRVIDRNFNDGSLDIHLQSKTPIAANLVDGRTTGGNGKFLLRNHAKSFPDFDMRVVAQREAFGDEFGSRATHASKDSLIIGTIDSAGVPHYVKRLRGPGFFGTNFEQKDVRERLSTLWAHQEIERLAHSGRQPDAVRLANVYRIVSSVSGAVVLEMQSDYDRYGLNRDMNQSSSYAEASPDAFDSDELSAPHLQGATNGTIGPMGADATVLTGVNTAGTVRVNNLAQMESALDFVSHGSGPLGQTGMNWMFASSRDANLFDGGPPDPSYGPADAILGWAAPLLALLALPLFFLNVLPPLVCLVRGTICGVTGKPGALRLLGIGISWAALAYFCPLASQCLALAVMFMLGRRKTLRKAALNGAS